MNLAAAHNHIDVRVWSQVGSDEKIICHNLDILMGCCLGDGIAGGTAAKKNPFLFIYIL